MNETTTLIRQKICRVLVDTLRLPLSEVDFESIERLDDLLGVDSITLIEATLGLEKEFAIRFEPEEIERDVLCDLSRLTACILGHLDRQTRPGSCRPAAGGDNG
jgi:acyl carrier protein